MKLRWLVAAFALLAVPTFVPPGAGAAPTGSTEVFCGWLPKVASQPPGYTATLRILPSKVVMGRRLRGRVVLHNPGKTTVTVDTVQPILVQIIDSKSRRIVGAYTGSIAGTGFGGPLRAGQSLSVAIVGSTTRCVGDGSSPLRPGRYRAIGDVSGPDITAPAASSAPNYYTSLASFEVVPR
jgi:hypothetical protein